MVSGYAGDVAFWGTPLWLGYGPNVMGDSTRSVPGGGFFCRRCRRYQNMYFKASWMLRGGSVEVIRPKLAGALMLAAGPPQLTRLKALKSSVRNWSEWLSKRRKFFWMLKSSETEPKPRRRL